MRTRMMDLVMREDGTFKRGVLRRVELVEKNSLPDEENLKMVKQHEDLLKEICDCKSGSLKKVTTRESMSGRDLALKESFMSKIQAQIQKFNKRRCLKKTETVEKVALPTAQDVRSARLRHDLLESVHEGVKLKRVLS